MTEAYPEAPGAWDAQNDSLFDAHLQTLEHVFRRASTANLRFKLTKCYFAQWLVDVLGSTAGVGVVITQDRKVDAHMKLMKRPSFIEISIGHRDEATA